MLRINIKRILTVLSVFILSLGITSCVYNFYINATGSLDQAIEFRFYESANDKKPISFDILKVYVQEKVPNSDEWSMVWHLSGSQSLNVIEYGKKYKKLDEIVPAKKLLKNTQYRLFLSGTKWPKSGVGDAGINFYFDDTGKLVKGMVE